MSIQFRCTATANHGNNCIDPARFWVYRERASTGKGSCAQHLANVLRAMAKELQLPSQVEPEFKVILFKN
jgi:hypothetical protein